MTASMHVFVVPPEASDPYTPTYVALNHPFQDAIMSGPNTVKVGASKGRENHLMI